MQRVIVVGIDHHNTLGLVRIMGNKDYEINVILYGCKDNSYVAASRYCDSVSYVSNASEAVKVLKKILEGSNEKPIVLTGADQISSLMDLDYDFFEDKCYFFNAGENGRVTAFMDKNAQVQLAANSGFMTPFSMIITDGGIANDEIPFPCILKPKESIHGGKDISICYDEKDLQKSLASFSTGNTVLLQQYIIKEKEIVILGYSIDGNAVISGFVDKHREYKGATTYSTTHSIKELPGHIIDSSHSMIKAIKYTGLWGIELICCNNNYYFIELNLRNDATSYSIVCAGADFVNEYCSVLTNTTVGKNDYVSIRSIDSMVEYEDFNFVLKREVSLFKWIKQKKQCDCKFFNDKSDPKPNKIKRRQYINFLWRRAMHK